jgi:hypothetical protein
MEKCEQPLNPVQDAEAGLIKPSRTTGANPVTGAKLVQTDRQRALEEMPDASDIHDLGDWAFKWRNQIRAALTQPPDDRLREAAGVIEILKECLIQAKVVMCSQEKAQRDGDDYEGAIYWRECADEINTCLAALRAWEGRKG